MANIGCQNLEADLPGFDQTSGLPARNSLCKQGGNTLAGGGRSQRIISRGRIWYVFHWFAINLSLSAAMRVLRLPPAIPAQPVFRMA
jgi:hypothetical protein